MLDDFQNATAAETVDLFSDDDSETVHGSDSGCSPTSSGESSIQVLGTVRSATPAICLDDSNAGADQCMLADRKSRVDTKVKRETKPRTTRAQPARRLDDTDREKIYALRDAGVSNQVIADQLGCSVNAVSLTMVRRRKKIQDFVAGLSSKARSPTKNNASRNRAQPGRQRVKGEVKPETDLLVTPTVKKDEVL